MEITPEEKGAIVEGNGGSENDTLRVHGGMTDA